MDSTNDIEKLLHELDELFRKVASAFHSSLAPGLSAIELDLLEQNLGVALPADFRHFFAWKSGQKEYVKWSPWRGDLIGAPDGTLSAWSPFPGRRLSHEPPATTPEERAADLFDWHPAWVPFLDLGDGDLLCVDALGCFGGQPGQVIMYVHDAFGWRSIEYSCLANWVATTIAILSDDSVVTPAGIDWEVAPEQEYRERLDPGYPLMATPDGEVHDYYGNRVR